MMEMEREKKKLVMEKCQSLLTELLRDEDNKYCVDCDAKSPRWASWNIGIFLCIRCAGIHRKLGVHISKVKSVNLDTWTPQQVANMGNSRARAVYEANLQDNFRRPQTDASLEQFIRAKYESKKYIAREWVPPPMPNPTWDLDIMKQLKKKRERKVVLGSIEFPAPIKSAAPKASTESPKPLPKAPGGRNASPGSASRRRSSGASNKEAPINPSATEDLLALDNPSSMNKTGPSDSSDIFGDFLAAPFVEGSADAEEKSFFNQTLPEPSSDKLSKDSILALYNKAPNHPTPFLGGGVPMMHLGTAVGPTPPLTLAMQGPLIQSQQHPMYFHQFGIPTGIGMQSDGTRPMYPLLPGGVQLSAGNPFCQMSNISLGNPSVGHQDPLLSASPAQMMVNNMNIANALKSANPNTMSTNLWP